MLNPALVPTPLTAQKVPFERKPVDRASVGRPLLLAGVSMVVFTRLIMIGLRPAAARPQLRGAIVRSYFERLGGMWLKVGQVLAMRVDVFSAAFCNELTRLQDRCAAFDTAIACGIIEAQLGCEIDEVYEVFEPEPIGAASLAQVHKAKLHDGPWVAIKVLRPHAERMFRIDFMWLAAGFKFFDLIGFGRSFNWADMLDEIRRLIEEELDYSHELAGLTDMRETLRDHGVYVPEPFPEYSGPRVLVMEFLAGVSIAEYLRVHRTDPERAEAWLDENDIDRAYVAEQLCCSLLRQMFEDNVCHGDLHPGNIMLLRDSHIALIDFGTVGSFDAEFTSVYRLYLTALAQGNYSHAADLMLWISKPLPPKLDLHRVRRELVVCLRGWNSRTRQTSLEIHERSLSSSSEEIGQIMIKYGFESNWSILKLGRTYNTLDMTLGAIYPEVDYPELLQIYHEGFMRRRRWKTLLTLLSIPHMLTEYAPLVLPRLREQTFEYSEQLSSGRQLLVWLLARLRVLFGAAFLSVVAVYLAHHHTQVWLRVVEPEGYVHQAARAVPVLEPILYMLISLAFLYLTWSAHKAIRAL